MFYSIIQIRDIMNLLRFFLISLSLFFLVSPVCAFEPPVKVGIYQNNPKVFINSEGVAAGFFVDLINVIAAKEQWKLEYIPCLWNECLKMLEQGQLDIMLDVAYSASREQRFDFNNEAVISSWSVIYQKKGNSIGSILDLDKKIIVVLRGSIQYRAIKTTASNFGISPGYYEVDSFEEALLSIDENKADFVLLNRFYGHRHMKLHNLAATNILIEPSGLKFAFSKNKNKHLIQTIDQHLRRLKQKEDSIYYSLIDKWLLITPSPRISSMVKWIVLSLLILLILLFVLFLRQRKLQHKVNDQSQEIEDKQQLYRDFFEQSKSANIIYTTTDNGETFFINKVNQMMEQIEGLKREDIVNKKLHEVFKGAEKSGIFDVIKQVYRTGQPCHLPTTLIEYNNKRVWRDNYIFKLSTGELVASYDDRTKEKELEFKQMEIYEKTLFSFVELIEQRDSYTGRHSQRVAVYSRMVAQEMYFSEKDCDLIYQAGMLHDIGKVITPDAILLKPGSLNIEEYQLIQSHVQSSADILKKTPMYSHLSEIVIAHHERYDGSGYPHGLKGDEIPFFARIMSVCDAFDAMTTNRIYKGRKSVHEALSELQSLVGIHYEKEIVSAATKVLSAIKLDYASQFPETQLEQQRFAYFFNDQLTGVYNQNYLSIILRRNHLEYKYSCLNIIFMKKFTQYNELFGWKSGDKLLSKFGKILHEQFSQDLVFRLHGDDFVIMSEIHNEIELHNIEKNSGLIEKNISLSKVHFHIESDEINTIESLENKF